MLHRHKCSRWTTASTPQSSCPRVQRFSNRSFHYQGKKIGDANNDNVRTINSNLATIAGYFPAMNCRRNSDCNDNDSSTVDTCVENNVCRFEPRTTTQSAAMLESMVVQSVSSTQWKTVRFSGTFRSPVVVCTIKYGTQTNLSPAVVRMKDVKSSSFSIRLQEPGSTSSVVSRHVHCIATERGEWTLPDGRRVEAQTYLSSSTDHKLRWVGTQRRFEQNFQNPVVVGQVMTSIDSKWSTYWQRGSSNFANVDRSNFWIGKHVGEDNVSSRLPELLGYIVIESGHAQSSGVELEATRGAPSIIGYTQGRQSYPFASRFQSAPEVIVATPLRMSGIDGCWTVLTADATTSSFGVAVDEDAIGDGERGHAAESLAFLAFSKQGTIPLGN